MWANIDLDGVMHLYATSDTEGYALKQWDAGDKI